MKHRHILICVCAILSLGLLAGCGASLLPDGFEGGETVTPARLDEIRAGVLSTAPETGTAGEAQTVPSRGVIPAEPTDTAVTEPMTEAKTADDTDTSGEAAGTDMPEGTVFWTAGGKVYHTDRGCYHLAKSTNVLSGSVADAEQAGKTGLCSACAKAASKGTDTQP